MNSQQPSGELRKASWTRPGEDGKFAAAPRLGAKPPLSAPPVSRADIKRAFDALLPDEKAKAVIVAQQRLKAGGGALQLNWRAR